MKAKDLEKFLQSKIENFIGILKIEMTRENIDEITYGEKLAAIGGLNMAVATMKEINPDYQFNIKDYYTPQEIENVLDNKQCVISCIGNNWVIKI
jgi:hypothetical protein